MKNMEISQVKKGDVWLVDNVNAVGYAQKGIRPHVVVTQVTGQTATVAPCSSSQKRAKQKYVVKLEPTKANGLRVESFVVLFQSFAADKDLFKKKIGHLSSDEIARIQIEYVKYVSD